MDNQPSHHFEDDLQRFPVSVLNEFRKAEKVAAKQLSGEDFITWAQEGIAIAHHSFRSWEAASDYFKATPKKKPRAQRR